MRKPSTVQEFLSTLAADTLAALDELCESVDEETYHAANANRINSAYMAIRIGERLRCWFFKKTARTKKELREEVVNMVRVYRAINALKVTKRAQRELPVYIQKIGEDLAYEIFALGHEVGTCAAVFDVAGADIERIALRQGKQDNAMRTAEKRRLKRPEFAREVAEITSHGFSLEEAIVVIAAKHCCDQRTVARDV